MLRRQPSSSASEPAISELPRLKSQKPSGFFLKKIHLAKNFDTASEFGKCSEKEKNPWLCK
jgi:hypothetical protein